MTTLTSLRSLDFQRLFSANSVADADVKDLIRSSDFRYTPLGQTERDEVLAAVTRHIDDGRFARSGPEGASRWESNWAAQLEQAATAKCSATVLLPSFIRPGQVCRLDQDYIRSASADMELSFLRVLRRWLFREYLESPGSVYEFGCGSGWNLVELASMFPDRRLCGLDWSPSSVALVESIAAANGLNMHGRQFDFFDPDRQLRLEPGCAVLTMCALEQVGGGFGRFLEFLLGQPLGVCLHIEPLLELYDGRHEIDRVAIKYHKNRGYLEGFLPALRQLRDEGRIDLRVCKRTYFGSLYHEAYSFVVWQPREHGSGTKG